MSFLELINRNRTRLKSTETYVTHPDGKVFKESKSTSELVCQQYGFVVDMKPDTIPAKVTDFIYLGSQDCCELEVLTSHNISRVLSVGIDAPVKYNTVTYKFVECLDLPETDLMNCLRECLPFLESSETECENVLVHCNAGVSRSASVVIGYLILIREHTYSEALQIVRQQRQCVKPNHGFEIQLKNLC